MLVSDDVGPAVEMSGEGPYPDAPSAVGAAQPAHGTARTGICPRAELVSGCGLRANYRRKSQER
jgi:hypothetical protein